jgi:hypothetical protein
MVEQFTESLAVSKYTTYRLHMVRFNRKELKEVGAKEQYHIKISNRFAALENLDTEAYINRAWETIRENIKISAKDTLGYYELKKHKSWLNERCSKLLDQRKQVNIVKCNA